MMAEERGKFRDEILEDCGEVGLSSTQKFRVLRVKDGDTGEVVLSVQKWWRKDSEMPWVAGKGFKLGAANAVPLGELMVSGGAKLVQEQR